MRNKLKQYLLNLFFVPGHLLSLDQEFTNKKLEDYFMYKKDNTLMTLVVRLQGGSGVLESVKGKEDHSAALAWLHHCDESS